MACSHPFGLERIEDESGKLIGGICPSCKRSAFLGESFWTQLKRNLRRKRTG